MGVGVRLDRFAWSAADSDDVRLEKTAILLVAGSCCAAGVAWTAMYVALFGVGTAAALPAVFVLIVGSSLVASHVSRNHRLAVYAQILCIIGITVAIQATLGGAVASGMVLVWAFCGPVAALVFFSPRRAVGWLALYLACVAVLLAADPWLAAHALPLGDGARNGMLILNFSIASIVVFGFAVYFVDRAREQRRRADALLLNILPRDIAPRLKREPQTVADAYESASVLFADMVGSTPLFAGMPASEVVDWLNEVFSAFDRLTVVHGVEKIRTIGDNYMVASGVPVRRDDHAEVLVAFALDLLDAVERIEPRNGQKLRFRVGIHSGPLIAGIIGEVKFQYDLWGDTVNVAARMESHGEVGRVHVSDDTYALVSHRYRCSSRGAVDIKGKGAMRTWFVEGPRVGP